MNRINPLLLFLCFFVVITAGAQQPEPQSVSLGQWIKSWALCGPVPLRKTAGRMSMSEHLEGFSDDYLQKYGGEENLHVQPGDEVVFPNGSVRWKLWNATDSIVDLCEALSHDAPVLAYAYTELFSDEAKMVILALGSNEGGKLWVNGVNVWEYSASRAVSPDEDLIPVFLKKGGNTILLKVEQRGSKWGFCMRLLPFSTGKLKERGQLFRVSVNREGEASLTSRYFASVLDRLVKHLDIRITNSDHNPVLTEVKRSDFCSSLISGQTGYQKFTAGLKIKLTTGDTLNQTISFFAGPREIYSLFAGRKTGYRIALGAEASGSEKWAAEELQHWLKAVGGADFPIQDLTLPFSGPQIVIGYNSLVKKITNAAPPDDLDESFRYFNSGADIFIYGGKARGSMYGVMAFLENELGCRWFTPMVNVVPERQAYSFDWLNHSEKPGIRVRNDFYFEAFDPEWATRNRMNGTLGFDEVKFQHGGTENYWSVHTFNRLVPPEEFFGPHPEYYSLVNGKRTRDNAQLCLTNPDVLKITIERIKKQMRENPGYLIYDVSQNDCRNPCQCDKCQAVVKKEGSESGLIIWFVNQVAEAVEKEFPDKFIGTLAYQYSRKPPKSVHPAKNVVVRLCSIECCFAHDFKTCPENRPFLDDLQKWSAITQHLYIWDYVVNFSHYIMPFPNFNVLQPNIQTLRDNHAIGIMEQGAYQSRGGEFAELRSYLISRLLWNPDTNVDKVIDDFMYGYYGRAGRLVRQYFDLLHRSVTSETHIHLGMTPEDQLFTDDLVNKSYLLFEEAKKVADNDDILHRVEMASLPVLYLKCKRMPVLAKYDGTYDNFCTIVKREGITHYAESGEPQRVSFHKTVEEAQ